MAAMVILNPYANRWWAGQRKDEALAALRTATFGPSSAHERPGPSTELADEAAIDGCSPIIAAGDHSDQRPGPDGRSVVA
jgi:hypothetical protein